MFKFLLPVLVAGSLLATEKLEVPVGKYDLETVIYVNSKCTTYIVETVLDTQTGKVIKRKRIKASSYKLPYKDRKGKIITQD